MTATPTPAGSALAARLAPVLEARGEVLEAYLFGSAARGESGPTSDVDVAVYLAPGAKPTGVRTAEIAADLASAAGTDAVDVVALNGAPPLLYHRVLRDGVRILTRDLLPTTRREGEALSRGTSKPTSDGSDRRTPPSRSPAPQPPPARSAPRRPRSRAARRR